MVWKRDLLLKTFLFSLFIHIAGISVFSLVLPISTREIKPLEVSLLPVAISSEEPATSVKSITPEIPRISSEKEKIRMEIRKEIMRFAPMENTRLSKIITPVEILSTVPDVPEIKIPEIASFPLVGAVAEKNTSISDIEIEGPAGGRILIYREPVEYPGWAIERAMEGNIRIKFWVAPDGKIVLTNIVTSSGYPELDLYAEQKLRRWVFNSVETDKQTWGLITFKFLLR